MKISKSTADRYIEEASKPPSSIVKDLVYGMKDLFELQWIRRSCKSHNVQCNTDDDCKILCLEGSHTECINRECQYKGVSITNPLECPNGCINTLVGDTQSGNIIGTCVNVSPYYTPDCKSDTTEWSCMNGQIWNGNCNFADNKQVVKIRNILGREYPLRIKKEYMSWFLLMNPNAYQ